MDPSAGLDGSGKTSPPPTEIRFPGPPALTQHQVQLTEPVYDLPTVYLFANIAEYDSGRAM